MMYFKLKRPYVSFVVIFARSMKYLFRKQLRNDSDLLINITVRHLFWNLYHHEPLILAFILPFFNHINCTVPQVIVGSKLLVSSVIIVKGRNPLILSAICVRCQNQFNKVDGIFCGNLLAARGTYHPFQITFFSNCYMW